MATWMQGRTWQTFAPGYCNVIVVWLSLVEPMQCTYWRGDHGTARIQRFDPWQVPLFIRNQKLTNARARWIAHLAFASIQHHGDGLKPPSHPAITITLSEIFGHASFVLVASSYAVDDFLTLRIVAVVGSAVMLVFTYFHPHGRVLWLPFKWNCLFIAINSYRIGKVFWYRYQAGRLPPDITSLYRKNFYLMDPVDFFSLVSIAKIEEFKADDVIIRQGQLNGRVFLVVDGALSVLRDGKLVYRLEEANFVSEAGLHTGLALPGEVEATCSVIADLDGRLLTWQRTDLVELMDRSPGLMRSFKATLSWDVIHKLKAQRVLITSGQIEDTEEWTERRKQQTQYRYTAIMKNILGESSHANLLEEKRKELNKYRTIHLISDEVHEKALHECGWTVEEFENGKKKEWEQIGWGEWDRLLHRIDTFIHRFLN